MNHFIKGHGDINQLLKDPAYRNLLYKNCKSCGGKVDFKSYTTADGVCPHCGQSVAPYIKEAHIYFASAVGLCVSRFLKDLRENRVPFDYKLFRLDGYMLDSGDISALPYSNENIYRKLLLSIDECHQVMKKKYAELSALDGNTEVYIWIEICQANEYLTMLYSAPLFKRFSKVHLVPLYSTKNIKDKHYNISHSLKERKTLTVDDLDEMFLQFQEIQRKDGEYRITIDGNTSVYTKNHFDNDILSCIKPKYELVWTIITRFWKKEKDSEKSGLTCDQLLLIIDGLLEKGLIEARFDINELGENQIRLRK